MTAVGAVTLSEHLTVPEIQNMVTRVSSTRYTMNPNAPRAVVQSYARPAGQEIRLVDDGDYGLFTGTQIDALNVYKASGETVVFSHHQGIWNVRVVSVLVTQAEGLADPGPENEYYGEVVLQIV